MPEPLVVLLHSAHFMPPAVLAYVTQLVPPGFRWRQLDQREPASVRLAAFGEARYIIAYPGDPRPEELAAASQLKLFQLLSAGYDWLDPETFRKHRIMLAGNAGSNATSTAEHTILLMLALLKQLPRHHQALMQGRWLGMEHAMELQELRGKVVGLVGFGRIAREVARRVHAFDASVRYAKPRRATAEEEAPSAAIHCSLEEMLQEAHIVSLHLPLTPATRGLIGRAALARMRPGSYLVNTARGALVDEVALYEALSGGQLAGAGLDVFTQEPPDPAAPLLQLPNVVLTPHIAGSTLDAWRHRMAAAWANIRRTERGEPPLARIA